MWYGPLPLAGPAPHSRRFAAWTIAATAVVLLAPAAGGAGPDAGSLRQQNVQIDASRHSAVLALYAIDSKLARAEARLTTLHAESARLRAERASAARAIRLARHDTRVAERRLAKRLRLIYEQGDVSPLEVLLGAKSLEEALTALESLDRVASQDKRVLAELKNARRVLLRLDRSIARRQARLAELEEAAAATANALAQARAAKTSYLSQLASQQRLNEAKVASLESQARAAETRTASLERQPVAVAVAAGGDVGPAVAVPQSAAAPESGGRAITVTATGYALPGHTATGIPVGWGVVAVDPSVIPLGTKLTIPGYGEAVAADVGGSVRGTSVDLWFPSAAQAQGWGRRTVTITLH